MIHELTENVAKALETVIPPPTQTEKDHAGKLAAMEAKMEETLARLAQMEKEYARFVQLEKELQNLKNEKEKADHENEELRKELTRLKEPQGAKKNEPVRAASTPR